MPGSVLRISSAARRPSSVLGRRHPDVDHRHVGLVGGDLPHQVLRVAGLTDDVEPRLVQQPHDPLAQQHGVLGDDYSHGIAARTRRALARGASRPRASRRAPRRGRAGRAARFPSPGRRRRRRRRRPRPAHWPLSRVTFTLAWVASRILRDVGERLGNDEVGRRLDALRQALARRALQLDRQRGAVGEPVERRVEAAIGEHGRVDAARELAQLLRARRPARRARTRAPAQRSGSPSSRERRIRRLSASDTRRCCAPSCRSRSRRRRAASPDSTIRARDALSSSIFARSSVAEPLVLECERRRSSPTARTSSRSVLARGVVHDHGDGSPPCLHGRDRSGPARRLGSRPAAVRIALLAVGRESRYASSSEVPSSASASALQIAAPAHAGIAEPGDHLAHRRRAGDAALQKSREEGERHGGEDHVPGVLEPVHELPGPRGRARPRTRLRAAPSPGRR